jgi:uncharacterized protein
MRKFGICLLLLFFVFAQSLVAQSKQQDIRKLVEIITPNTMADMMQPMFQQYGINAPRTFYVTFFGKNNVMNDYYNIVIPLYDKYFTQNDINEMLKFYQTPTGRKMLETQGSMLSEAMPLISAWSQRVTPLLLDELTNAGYK